MSHEVVAAGELYERLRQVDERLVDEVRRSGCAHCGGRLDRADFPRKARGVPQEAEEHVERRFALCCARDGCRRRTLPPSVRFLGRRVYAAVAVVTVCMAESMRRGWQEVRRVRRWLRWWRRVFPTSAIFIALRGRFAIPVRESALPKSLFERFERESTIEQMVAFLTAVAGSAHAGRGSAGDTQRMVLGKVRTSE